MQKFKKPKSLQITLISILLVILIVGICLFFWLRNPLADHELLIQTPSSAMYLSKHKAINDPNPKIDYNKPTKASQVGFATHIDSFNVKDNKRIYFDSLLERYSYYDKVGNPDFVNSYIGSHGIISHDDPILPVHSHFSNKIPKGISFKNTAPYLKQMKTDNRNPHPSLALSNSIQYSNLQLNNQKLIDYANKFRARNINALESADGYMINGKYHAIIEPQVDPYADKQIQYYYIQDCAPSESYDLNNFIRTTQKNSIRYRVPEDAKEEAYVKWCVPIYRERFAGKFVDEGGDWVKEYLDGKSLFNKLKVPTDQTRDFQVNSLKIDDLYNSQRKTLYSNGNSYFLQQMYKNMQHINNYHLISVYNSNWYLSPVIFNTFVRNINQYNSPYLFNYWQNNQALLEKAKPNTQKMTSFLEHQSNNLPANYDQNHYYYRTLEGTLVRDDNIKSINNNQSVLIMGNPHDDRSQIGSKKYYQSELEYDYAKKYQGKPEEASKFLNFKRCDGGFEPLWKIGLENSYKIGKYHPGEILKFADNLSNNQISNYYVIQNDQKFYIPTYNVDGQTCFKVKFTPQEPFGEYVRAQDVWLLNGSKVYHK